MIFCVETGKKYEIHMEFQRTLNSQNNLRKKNKGGGLTLPDFKTYHKAIVIKKIWYCHKDRHTDQRNRVENLKINPHIYSQLSFGRGARATEWGKESL